MICSPGVESKWLRLLALGGTPKVSVGFASTIVKDLNGIAGGSNVSEVGIAGSKPVPACVPIAGLRGRRRGCLPVPARRELS